jgi:hypothetical protein
MKQLIKKQLKIFVKQHSIKSICLSANKGFCMIGMKSNNECNFTGKCVNKQTIG